MTAPAAKPETIFRLKKMNMIRGGIVISQHVHEKQVPLGQELALEVEQRELDGGVLVAGQEVESV